MKWLQGKKVRGLGLDVFKIGNIDSLIVIIFKVK